MDNMDHNKKIFSKTYVDSTWYNTQPSHRFIRHLAYICLQKIIPDSIHTVLDVGCGDGFFTVHISEALPNANILGIDFSQLGITQANLRRELCPPPHTLMCIFVALKQKMMRFGNPVMT
jgi:tRNA G46 methylase TrmB